MATRDKHAIDEGIQGVHVPRLFEDLEPLAVLLGLKELRMVNQRPRCRIPRARSTFNKFFSGIAVSARKSKSKEVSTPLSGKRDSALVDLVDRLSTSQRAVLELKSSNTNRSIAL